MTDAFDLDALENEGEPFTFIHAGTKYQLPPDIDLTTLAVMDSGDLERAMQRLLGEDTWKGLVDSGKPFGVKKMMTLLNAYAKHLGLESLGGSSASVASLPNTAQR